MEGEIKNFTAVWITVLASLCYCHTIAKFIPQGTTRLFSILPIITLFLYLPVNLTTIHLCCTTAFFITWLANFKLLLFAFDKAVARALTRIEFEPQFDEPYLSTSLQDFWGRRWNLMVTGILRPTVYEPVQSFSARVIRKEWAVFPAIIATFIVSGLMHELVFYYLGRLRPTLEVTCFFLIHGICLTAEIAMKKALIGKFRLPRFVAGPLVIGFVVVTGLWLFFPPILRFDIDIKARRESAAFVEFVKDVIRVSKVGSSNVTTG